MHRGRAKSKERKPKKERKTVTVNKRKNKCDDNDSVWCKIEVIDNSTFLTIKSDPIPDRMWTLQKWLGSGEWGATFLATSQNDEGKNDEVFVSKSVVVKALLPGNEPEPDQEKYDSDDEYEPEPDQEKYDIQEYENQHYLACRWNDELKILPRSTAKFPEVYFIGLYDSSPTLYDPSPTVLTLFNEKLIKKSVIAGMEKLEFTLQDTLRDLIVAKKHEEIAKLANNCIISVANTLQTVNRFPNLNFVHGDLHVGNIMHDKTQQNFHIIDFGASRINEKVQLPIEGNPYYSLEKGEGSRGIDLMKLCLSLVEYIDSPYLENTDEKGLLSHLWYPLWCFFKKKPHGRYPESIVQDDGTGGLNQFLDPKSTHFLATGCLTKPYNWPDVWIEEDQVYEELVLFKYFGYDPGDRSPKTLEFDPDKILMNNAVNDRGFMEAMRNNFSHNNSTEMLEKLRTLEEKNQARVIEESMKKASEASVCDRCTISYMPQYRTFTL